MSDKRGTFTVAATAQDHPTITLEGDSATLTVGSGPQRPAPGQGGRIDVVRSSGQLLLRVGTSQPTAGLAAEGQLSLFDASGKATISLRPEKGDLQVGGNGQEGDIRVLNPAGVATIRMEGGDGVVRLGGGANGPDGDLVLYKAKLEDSALPKGTIHLDGGVGRARLGGHGTSGHVLLFRSGANMADDRNATVFVDGAAGDCWLGGNGVNGNLMVFPASATGAALRDASKAAVHIDGDAGDIVLRNADCAEDFDVAGQAEAGDVMVLADDGQLRCCEAAYDRAVVGVVSGAGGFRPGIVLDRRHGAGRRPIALMGKVFCKVDASERPVRVGDLLTTSGTAGHAMAASDRDRAFGAILGKALQAVEGGRALIPVLVTLQ